MQVYCDNSSVRRCIQIYYISEHRNKMLFTTKMDNRQGLARHFKHLIFSKLTLKPHTQRGQFMIKLHKQKHLSGRQAHAKSFRNKLR
jgi:hypothetical protein